MYLAPARKRLAEIYEIQNEPEKAYAVYAALAKQWHNADPELQPVVRSVKERMAAIERKRAR